MRRVITIVLFLFALESANAQIMPQYKNLQQSQSDSLSFTSSIELNNTNIQFNTESPKNGNTALITGCALTLIGAALYASSWGMTSDSSSIGSYFSIAGLSCIGLSIPFYVTEILRRQ